MRRYREPALRVGYPYRYPARMANFYDASVVEQDECA